MFSRFTTFAARKCLHTRASAHHTAFTSRRLTKAAVGASLAATAYLSWRLAFDKNHIALDSSESHSTKTTNLHHPKSPSLPSEPPVFIPDSPPASDSRSSASSESDVDPKDNEGGDASSDGASSEESGASGGAYNPVTGEINWDCPCLGGMAHGPCGPEFREAFSCFVFSEDEPKGINCVEKFKHMQDCFRAHPEVYADEIMNDDDEGEEALPVTETTGLSSTPEGTAVGEAEPEGIPAPEKPRRAKLDKASTTTSS